MRKIELFVLVALAMQSSVHAQDGEIDYQLRIPTHIHIVRPGANIGFGGWVILPDVTAKGNNFRTRIAGGVVYKSDKRWIEIMGGALIPQAGKIDPHMNIVFSDRSRRRIGVFSNVEIYPRTRRTYSLTWIDTPVNIWKFKTRVGAQIDCTFFLGKKDARGIGPHVVIPLNKRISLVTAYHFRNDGPNILRQYVVLNLP